MGWTHDFTDEARNRRSTVSAGVSTHEGGGPRGRVHQVHDLHRSRLGISRILRRRARWVSARLRHPRN
ncbi:hypothetical protein ACFYZ6_05800 [Streptomyces rubiginosohelvolus]|uniref:Uncharacterized protein n=3 Tax=Streptomyces TaxID=1883 RepID=A0ABN8V466_STRGL|nr:MULTISPECIES: hypothetical protein [Streptomyces]NED03598.1 hypothetical protein [Streptomyces sp. SID6648]PPA40891.1 hypothetical protein BF14_014675 [Streptomyces griseus]AWL87040.1 hypothetical protein DIJ69_14675 [Streptomyces globisporus]MCA1271515.1 hypothetical protein [Streptomyces sp. 7G]MCT6775127.1 hypothetical protein [Streptomyces sp. CS-7]